MADLIAWTNSAAAAELPAPVVAGVFMYQLLTVHPYLDGNGRTARALATYVLKRAGLGLRGLLVLERYYDRDLTGYYANLQMGLNHNYYFGRNNADLTPWLSFFIAGLADVFTEAARLVRAKSDEFLTPEPELLRRLDPYQRQLFSQLALHRDRLTVTDVSNLTGLAGRTVREKLHAWIADGFVQAADPGAQRIRSVTLTAPYRELAAEVANDPKRYPYLLG
jgi:Fic family protein